MDAPALLIDAPCGYLLSSGLSSALEGDRRPLAWLRFGPEDADPASCLLSLSRAVQALAPQAGSAAPQQEGLPGWREQAGTQSTDFWQAPGAGRVPTCNPAAASPAWPDAFSGLAHAAARQVSGPAALVLEHLHHLADSPQTLRLLEYDFLARLPENVQVILTTQQALPDGMQVRLRRTACVRAKDLQLAPQAVADVLSVSCSGLPEGCIRRAAALLQGKAVALASLGSAAALLGGQRLRQRLERARTPGELLDGISQDCVAALETRELPALALLAALGYNHPRLNQAISGDAPLPPGPWQQSLRMDWVRVYGLWRQPLKMALHSRQIFDESTLAAAAERLCRQDAPLEGVRLLFELGYARQAAGCLAENAARLAGLGLWETLEQWLEILPEAEVMEQPRLLAVLGELKTRAGDLQGARRAYRRACERFVSSGDTVGACTSLLALSTLATWNDDLGNAWANADAARYLAQRDCLPGQQGWAEFQLARLSAREGNYPITLEHLRNASQLARRGAETILLECIQNTAALVTGLEQRQQQRVLQQRLAQEAEEAERQQARRLELALQTPPGDGWSPGGDWLQEPLLLKYPQPNPADSPGGDRKPPGRWKQLQNWLHARHAGPPDASQAVPCYRLAWPSRDARSGEAAQDAGANADLQAWREPGAASASGEGAPAGPAELARQPVQNDPPPASRSLNVYLLGRFQVEIGGRPLEKLPGGRSGMLLKYLIVHHQRRLPREQLMEVFWPEADPETARNRLNVALCHVRQALRTATDMEVVTFEDGKYGIDPAWTVWLDVEAFEHSLAEASRLSSSNRQSDAIRQLEAGSSLYQGDYLADDPYEEWTIATRERLRLAYLDALYQLSRHSFKQEQYAACTALCQLILERDNCREDVHCLLMRCYAAQGQYHLAARQYQACADALRQELEVGPAASTTAVYQQIKRGERTPPGQ